MGQVTGEQMEQPKQSNSDATYTTARAQKATEAKDKADGMLRKQQVIFMEPSVLWLT